MAVTAACRDAPQLLGGIGQQGKGTSEEADAGEDASQGQGAPVVPGLREESHEGSLRSVEKKTDSSGRGKFLLPGSWNWLGEEANGVEKAAFPETVLGVP